MRYLVVGAALAVAFTAFGQGLVVVSGPTMPSPTTTVGLPEDGSLPTEERQRMERAMLLEEQQQAEDLLRHEAELRREEERYRLEELERQRLEEEASAATLSLGADGQPVVGLPRAIPGALVGGPPVNSATNLYGIYTVGRGAQVFSWTLPLQPGTTLADTNFTDFKLYWWASGSSVTNVVQFPKDVQKILMSGIAGGSKPLTFFQMTVLNGALESVPSNRLLVPSEP